MDGTSQKNILRMRCNRQLRNIDQNMADVFSWSMLIRTLILIAILVDVNARFCVNRECTEAISTARIKKIFKTKDVHLYVGDEVDVTGKSDDGSISDFEIGDVRGSIPSSYLREDTYHVEMENLIHVPDDDESEDDNEENQNGHKNDDEIDDQFDHVDSDDRIPKPRPPKKEKSMSNKADGVVEKKQKANNDDIVPAEVNPATKDNERLTMNDNLNKNLADVNGGLGDISQNENDKLKEFFKSEEEALLKTFEKKANENLAKVDENPAKIDENAEKADESSANVDENDANVDENAAKVEENSAKVDENSAKVDENSAKVEENSAKVEENSAKVDENSAKVDENSAKVEENSATVDENSAKVDENSAKVEENSAKVDENAAKVDKNAARVEENAAKVEEISAKVEENADKNKETKAESSEEKVSPDNNKDLSIEPVVEDHSIHGILHGSPSHKEQLDFFKEEMQKLPNFGIIKKRQMKDYLADNYKDKTVDEETLKKVEEFIVNDMISQLREPENPLMEMMINYDPKDLPGQSDDDKDKKTENEEETIQKKEDSKSDPQNINFEDHPNFPALKQKHIQKYLSLHYADEEPSQQVIKMVDRLITDDLLKQLKEPNSLLLEDLLSQDVEEPKDNVTTEKGIGLDRSNDEDHEVAEKIVENAKKSLNGEENNEKSKIKKEIKFITDDITSNVKEGDQKETEQLSEIVKENILPKDEHILIVNSTEKPSNLSSSTDNEDATGPIPPGSETSSKPPQTENGVADTYENVSETVIDKPEKQQEEADNVEAPDNAEEMNIVETKEETSSKQNAGSISFMGLGKAFKNRIKAFANKLMKKDLKERKDKETELNDKAGDLDQVGHDKDLKNIDEKETIKDDSKQSNQEVSENSNKSELEVSDDSKKSEQEVSEDSKKSEQKVSKDSEQSKQEVSANSTKLEQEVSDDSKQSKQEVFADSTKLEQEVSEDSMKSEQEVSVDSTKLEQEASEDSKKSELEVSDDSTKLEQEVSEDSTKLEQEVSVDSTKLEQEASEDSKKSEQEVSEHSTKLEQEASEDSKKSELEVSDDSKQQKQEVSVDSTVETAIEEKGKSLEVKLSSRSLQSLDETMQSSYKSGQSSPESVESSAQPVQSSAESSAPLAESTKSSAESAQSSDESVQSSDESAQSSAESAQPSAESPQSSSESAQSSDESTQSSDESPQSSSESPQSSAESSDESAQSSDAQTIDHESEQVESQSSDNPVLKEGSEHENDSDEGKSVRNEEDTEKYESINEEQYSRDDLLAQCHNEPSLPACDQLRGTKIFRGNRRAEEKASEGESIGKLDRAWRNILKIMQRIKMMKLGFVRLFHGPLTILGLDEISHWIHEQIDNASPEVITITFCCILLSIVLLLKYLLAEKTANFGVSVYDVRKMEQSRQRILQENSESLDNEICELKEKLSLKTDMVESGDETVKELEGKLKELKKNYLEQEQLTRGSLIRLGLSSSSSLSERGQFSSSSSSQSPELSQTNRHKLLQKIREEVNLGKKEQKKLHSLIDEKEKEIQQADQVALRHQNEIGRQTEITDDLNERLQKVVEELDLKDGIVLDMQEKIGALHVELENMEMERRQVDKEKKEIAPRVEELEEAVKLKEEENNKLQDELDEKENEIEVLRDCMAQINNGTIDADSVSDFETPEDDPDIKQQLKSERLKQILETTQGLVDLRKSEKEKEFFQEGYLEELEKRETAEADVKRLQSEVEKLSKESQIYKTTSTELNIKLETLQQYFKQQETELHRKLSFEEQTHKEYKRKYEELIGESSTAIEETANFKLQIEDLKNEIKDMERNFKEKESTTEKEIHDLWIKFRQANRDAEEMKRDRDFYRKRLLDSETTKKRASPVPLPGLERSRNSPAGSDEGRPISPSSQKSGASGLPNFVGQRPPFMPPPPPPLFGAPPGPMPFGSRMPMGPMASGPGQFAPMPIRPQMMGGPTNSGMGFPLSSNVSGVPSSSIGGPPNNNMGGPPSSSIGNLPSSNIGGQPNSSMGGPPSGSMAGPPSSTMSVQGNSGTPNAMNQPTSFSGQHFSQNIQSNPGVNHTTYQSSMQSQPVSSSQMSYQNQRPPIARTNSQKSLSSNSSRSNQGQTMSQNLPRGFMPSSTQGNFQSTPINSPNTQQQGSQPQYNTQKRL